MPAHNAMLNLHYICNLFRDINTISAVAGTLANKYQSKYNELSSDVDFIMFLVLTASEML